MCLAVARSYCAEEQDAQDATQEALIRAWRSQSKLRDRDRRAGWLARIARREALRLHARRRRATIGEAAEAATASPSDSILERIDVARALERLDPEDLIIARLRYGEDLTQPRIAEVLNMAEGTVKIRLHRLRKRLGQELESP